MDNESSIEKQFWADYFQMVNTIREMLIREELDKQDEDEWKVYLYNLAKVNCETCYEWETYLIMIGSDSY